MTESRRKRRQRDLTDSEIAERVRNLARAQALFPALFGDDAKPLAIGVGKRLQNALGLSATATHNVLQWWVRRREYLQAVSEPSSKRFDLDGSVASDVSQAHRDQALAELTAPRGVSKPKAKLSKQEMGPLVMSATVNARSIKATLLLEASDIAGLKVFPGTSRVALTVKVAGRALLAELNAKSVRKAVAAIEAAGAGGAAVVLQGRLDEGDKLLDAGITVQAKVPKSAVAA